MTDQDSPSLADTNDDRPQVAQAKTGRRTSNPQHVTEFFDRFHDRLEKIANELGVDKRLIMAQAAYESGWFQDQPKEKNYSRSNNNLFGYSKKEIPMKYSDVEENIRQWQNKWGSIIHGVGNDIDAFFDRLLRPPINPRTGKPAYEAYNQRPEYEAELRGVINSIYNRLPIWNVDQMEKRMSPAPNQE